MTAVELLKRDHREASGMIEQLQSTEGGLTAGGAKLELFGKLKAALSLHTSMEEQIFYHALANLEETRDLIQESYKEHRQVDELLVKMSQPSGEWESQLDDLKGKIEHHVEEEEGELFPKAERLLGEARLEEMGRQMEQIKQGKSAQA
jgi:hemerythrin superfamily protein